MVMAAKPRSFRIRRQSPLASFLKSSISEKLPRFLGDYFDEVLAEYITVLVCNGKHQYQARDDLDAFLGDKTAEFVSWLWAFLSRHAHEHKRSTRDTLTDSDADASLSKDESTYTQFANDMASPPCLQRPTALNDPIHTQPNQNTKSTTSTNFAREQIAQNNYNGLQKIVSVSRYLQPPISVPCQDKKRRGSVWDRLGKPCDESSVNDKVELLDAGIAEKQVLNQQNPMLLVPKGVSKNKTFLVMKPDGSCEIHFASNVRQKRDFSESSPGNAICTSLDNRRKVGSQCDASSQDLRKKVRCVGQRLREMETEMLKLQTKWLGKEKDVKTNSLLSHSDLQKNPEGVIESRTVFVSNVHIAATKEALSLYFARCGVVENVVTLTDKETCHLKWSAYVTFASKESVDKAVALCGATFFSRTLKILRKVDAAAAISSSTQPVEKLLSAPGSHLNWKNIHGRRGSHLQWRRESATTLSEPSVSATVEQKEVASLTCQRSGRVV